MVTIINGVKASISFLMTIFIAIPAFSIYTTLINDTTTSTLMRMLATFIFFTFIAVFGAYMPLMLILKDPQETEQQTIWRLAEERLKNNRIAEGVKKIVKGD